MKKIIMVAIATMLTVSVFAQTGDCKKCAKKPCTTVCRSKCTKIKCSTGFCK
jgi:hypothetical protein